MRGLAPVLAGERVARVVARREGLRYPFPPDLGQRLVGARVTALGRRAKYGLIDTDRGDTVVFHLGMSGRWRVDPDELGAHDHLVLETGGGRTLALNDPRRFGFVHLHATDDLPAYPPFAAMGPEPLGDGLTPGHLLRMFEGRAAPIKALLLDQRVVAGLGNIYVCEALHMARIAPNRAGGRIALFRLERLVEAIRRVLEAAIAAGGSSLRDYVRADGEVGHFQDRFDVYDRPGRPCARCPGPPACPGIARIVQAGRSTFFCPRTQR